MAYKLVDNIAHNKPELGGVVAYITSAAVNVPVVANRPYILGSAVTKVHPQKPAEPTKVFVGKAATILGVMALGSAQVRHYDHLVEKGFADTCNNMGCGGVFYGALDLQHYDAVKMQTLLGTGAGKLYVDDNGVFSFSDTDNGNTEVTNAFVISIDSQIIVPAMNKQLNVGGQQYTFNYPKGIGAIAIKIA